MDKEESKSEGAASAAAAAAAAGNSINKQQLQSMLTLPNIFALGFALLSIYFYSCSFTPASAPTSALALSNLPDRVLDILVDAARERYKPDLFQDLDLSEFGGHARNLQDLWNLYLEQVEDGSDTLTANTILSGVDRLGHVLYPWISEQAGKLRRVSQLPRHYTRDKGIMVTAGAGQMRVLLHLIVTLRFYHHCKLPIEVVYHGDGDLPPEHRQFIESLASDVKCVDIDGLFGDPADQMGMPGGWAIRPFALLGCSFRHAMLCDADAIFLRDPTPFFEERDYKETGTLFWRDRIIGPIDREKHDFVDYMIDRLAVRQRREIMEKSMWFAGETDYELESGVLLMDKYRNLGALLMICHLNLKRQREEVTYKKFHGDKESYWLGMAITSQPFRWSEGYGGGLGIVQGPREWVSPEAEKLSKDRELPKGEPESVPSNDTQYSEIGQFICTLNILHTLSSDNDAPVWINNGLLKHKHSHDRNYLEVDGWVGINGVWKGEGDAPYVSQERFEGAMWCVAPPAGGIVHSGDEWNVAKMIRDMVEMAKDIDAKAEALGLITITDEKA